MAWLGELHVENLRVVGQKEQDGKTYTYLAKRLESGTVALACVVQDDDQERVVERGLVPGVVVEWVTRNLIGDRSTQDHHSVKPKNSSKPR